MSAADASVGLTKEVTDSFISETTGADSPASGVCVVGGTEAASAETAGGGESDCCGSVVISSGPVRAGQAEPVGSATTKLKSSEARLTADMKDNSKRWRFGRTHKNISVESEVYSSRTH